MSRGVLASIDGGYVAAKDEKKRKLGRAYK
jgi:hypothetical protein